MKPLFVAFLFFATSNAVAEVTLTDISNNEVADAEVVMGNFNTLKDAIEVLQHPEGDIFFRHTDASTLINIEGLGIHKRDTEEISLELDVGSWGPIQQQGTEPWVYTQQGIVFYRNVLSRIYPAVAPPAMCPQGTVVAFPMEVFEGYHNQFGSIIQSTSWDFGEYGGPHPSAMADNPSGSYACVVANESGEIQDVVSVVNFGSLIGSGRYQCAVVVESQLVAYGIDATASSLPVTQIGDSVATVQTSYRETPALLSADIPAACNELQSKRIDIGSKTSVSLFGFDIEWPPQEKE